MAVRLEDWIIRAPPGGRSESDTFVPAVCGRVYGHPRYKDGTMIILSRIKEVREDTGIIVSKNTHYVVGQPDEDYAAANPDARGQLLPSCGDWWNGARRGEGVKG